MVDVILMSSDVWAEVAIFTHLNCIWCVVIVNCLGQVLYLDRASRTKETLPNFRERCRVTRHSRVFRELTGCQRTLGFWDVTTLVKTEIVKYYIDNLYVSSSS